MYEYIEGNIEAISPTHAIISTAGLGYRIAISLTTYEVIKGNKVCRLFLELLFKVENQSPVSMSLYGFADPEEREMFRALTNVSGVGNNTAMLMLSSLNPGELASAILNGNVGLLKSIKGIGEKTAQRIVLELRDKLGSGKKSSSMLAVSGNQNEAYEQALLALTTLGYVRASAEKALLKITKELGHEVTVEELIKNSLKIL